MKKAILGILLLGEFAFGVCRTFAQCDCSWDIFPDRRPTAYDELKKADVVFYGQIVEMRMLDQKPEDVSAGTYEIDIKFRVEKAWRKDLDELVTVREYRYGCIHGFGIADRWLVYARFDKDNYLRTGYCSLTKRADKNVENDFKEFEKNGAKQTKIIKVSRK